MKRWLIQIEDDSEFTVCPYCNYRWNNEYFFEAWRFRYCPHCGERVGVAIEYIEHEESMSGE